MSRKLLGLVLLSCGVVVSCNKTNPVNPDPGPERDSLVLAMWQDAFAGSGFESADSIVSGKYFKDGAYAEFDKKKRTRYVDNRYEFLSSSDKMRYVSESDGYAITLPQASGMTPDYTAPKYGMYFDWGDARLRVTLETVTPYAHNEHYFRIYTTEWLDRYIDNDRYVQQNSLTRTMKTIRDNETLIPGYSVNVYSIQVRNAGALPHPNYKIAIIRKVGQWGSFGLLVFKYDTSSCVDFNEILKSWTKISPYGNTRNYYSEQEPVAPSAWSESTKKFYEKLLSQRRFDFGAFSASMSQDDSGDYQSKYDLIDSEKSRLEKAFGCAYGIMPTYMHISWYGDRYYFPKGQAAAFAGGDGFNGKPVLQLSYQFTENNNDVSPSNTTACQTPMFDILRGRYDDYFNRLAADIKAYGKPVFFRLNNEMNSDWTSYCGMMTLIDPEIFIQTWRYLYDIFEKNGVDNCIWVFNPIAKSCPYSNWGEDMAYYPGNGYVQALGLTNYEMGNSLPFESFRDKHTQLYSKNRLFTRMPWVIGEFACGCGGNSDGGVLKRNREAQARWVSDMFDEFANYDANEYLHPIKAIVWFSVNDYSGDRIVNQLSLDADLTETLDAFKNGFAKFE